MRFRRRRQRCQESFLQDLSSDPSSNSPNILRGYCIMYSKVSPGILQEILPEILPRSLSMIPPRISTETPPNILKRLLQKQIHIFFIGCFRNCFTAFVFSSEYLFQEFLQRFLRYFILRFFHECLQKFIWSFYHQTLQENPLETTLVLKAFFSCQRTLQEFQVYPEYLAEISQGISSLNYSKDLPRNFFHTFFAEFFRFPLRIDKAIVQEYIQFFMLPWFPCKVSTKYISNEFFQERIQRFSLDFFKKFQKHLQRLLYQFLLKIREKVFKDSTRSFSRTAFKNPPGIFLETQTHSIIQLQ